MVFIRRATLFDRSCFYCNFATLYVYFGYTMLCDSSVATIAKAL